MAGSYEHCLGPDGKFRMGLIENLGDAHEALDHMFFMIWKLSEGDPAKIRKASNAYFKALVKHKGSVVLARNPPD